MSTNTKVTKLVNKVTNQQKELIQVNNSFIIFPYLPTGYLDFTNRGVEQNQRNVNDFETFKRVWTGNDACVLSWKDSIRFTQNEDKTISTEFKLGEVLIGLLLNNSRENELVKDSSFAEYTSQQTRGSLSFRVNSKYFTMNDNWTFYFYKIPEISGSTLYKVQSFTPEYIGTEIVGYLVEMVTINQDLANTGRAKQQNIMPSSPGQGYLEGVVLKPGELNPEGLVEGTDYYQLPDGRVITADWAKIINNPIKKVVVKIFGASIFSNIVFNGRRVPQVSTLKEFGKPVLIFPINLETASTPTLYRSQSAETNFYWVQDAMPTLQYWKDLFETIKGSMNPVNEFRYQGFLTYNLNKTIATNPKGPNGSYQYSLFGFLEPSASTGGFIKRQWLINTESSIKNTSMIYGCEREYRAYGSFGVKPNTIDNYMFDAYWTQKKYLSLPMNAQSHIGFGWTLGSSLGAIVTGKYWAAALLWGIGLVGFLTSKLSGPFYEGFSGIISAPLLDLSSDQFSTSSTPGDKIDFSVFDTNNKDTPSSAFFDGSTLTTSFQADLTDMIISGRAGVLSTECIGQTHKANGSKILPDGSPFLLNGDASLSSADDTTGYIIDSFNIQAIFSGDFSIEFLGTQNEVVWSGVYLSEGKWTGSNREINSWKDTSVIGRENTFFNEPLPYPKPLPELIGDLAGTYDLTKFYNSGYICSAAKNPTSDLTIVDFLKREPTYTVAPDLKSFGFQTRFTIQILERRFNSIAEFWNLYKSMTITLKNLKASSSGHNKVYQYFDLYIKSGETSAEIINNRIESYSWLDRKFMAGQDGKHRCGFGNFYFKRSTPVAGGLTWLAPYNGKSTISLVGEIVLIDNRINLVVTCSLNDKFDTTVPNLEIAPWLKDMLANQRDLPWETPLYWLQEIYVEKIFFKAK